LATITRRLVKLKEYLAQLNYLNNTEECKINMQIELAYEIQNRIAHQKLVANKVLKKLELLDRYCIVAGGAPRDWYLGNIAKDIDVYLHYPLLIKSQQREDLLNELGLNVQSKCENWEQVAEIYQTNRFITQLYNSDIQGEKVQIMFVSKPTFISVVDTFPISISKVWYKKEEIGLTPEFETSVKHKILWKTVDSYLEDDKYLTKIKEKFSDYIYVPKEVGVEFMGRK